MAYNISVAVGDNDTIAAGFAWILTGPFAALTVSGNCAAVAAELAGVAAEFDGVDELPQPATTSIRPVAEAAIGNNR